MARVAMSPLSLYRHLLRKVNALPNDAQSYYKHRIRQVDTTLTARDDLYLINRNITIILMKLTKKELNK